jgi:predicted nucleotidyltransferase
MIDGLTQAQNSELLKLIKSTKTITKVVVFGSRAMGNYKPGSDVDLAIWGDSFGAMDAANFAAKLNEESRLPYKFDVVAFNAITSNVLREHIITIGKVIFERE